MQKQKVLNHLHSPDTQQQKRLLPFNKRLLTEDNGSKSGPEEEVQSLDLLSFALERIAFLINFSGTLCSNLIWIVAFPVL